MPAGLCDALCGREKPRVPEHERHPEILVEQRRAVSHDIVRRAERFTMIAGDDDERVVRKAARAQHLEQPAEMSIRLTKRVEISLEQLPLRHTGLVEEIRRLRV